MSLLFGGILYPFTYKLLLYGGYYIHLRIVYLREG